MSIPRRGGWILFCLAMVVALALGYWLHRELGRLDALLFFTELLVAGPILVIAAFHVFPNRSIVAGKSHEEIEVRRTWLGMVYKRVRIPLADLEEVAPAVVGVTVQRRTGHLDGASTAVGIASLLLIGHGWVKYETEEQQVPAFGVMRKRREGRPLVTHVTWSQGDCHRAVNALRVATGRGQLAQS